jgi:hypothetical protein
VLSGFDRLVFRGTTLRFLAHHLGMMRYLWAMQVLPKDFAGHAEAVTQQLRKASEAHARDIGRPILYMPSSATSKEDRARAIARQDGIEQGLLCILTAVEPCLSYDIIRNREAKHLEPAACGDVPGLPGELPLVHPSERPGRATARTRLLRFASEKLSVSWRAWPGHLRFAMLRAAKTWVAGLRRP